MAGDQLHDAHRPDLVVGQALAVDLGGEQLGEEVLARLAPALGDHRLRSRAKEGWGSRTKPGSCGSKGASDTIRLRSFSRV